MHVSELGLVLHGVPQSMVDAVQMVLTVGEVTPWQARQLLRPLCGPEQDSAETQAWLCFQLHVPDGAAGWCSECQTALPCPVVAADVRVIGADLKIADLERQVGR